jgi:hypothetical protein
VINAFVKTLHLKLESAVETITKYSPAVFRKKLRNGSGEV